MCCRNSSVEPSSDVANRLCAAFEVEHALMHVHGAAGLALHRLGHEGGVNAVLERRLAQRALEQERLIGELQRVAVVEIDLHLGGAGLVGQGVDVDLLRLAPVVDVLEDRIELVDRLDAVALARRFRSLGAADRRLQRIVGILVDLGQEELELGRDHRPPAAFGIGSQDPAQDLPGRDRHLALVVVAAVADHLGGRFLVPRHDAQRARIRTHAHVAHRRVGHPILVRIVAGHGLHEDHLGQPQGILGDRADELLGRQDLAPGDAVEVGDQALDLGDPTLPEPALHVAHGVLSGELSGAPDRPRRTRRTGGAIWGSRAAATRDATAPRARNPARPRPGPPRSCRRARAPRRQADRPDGRSPARAAS